MKKNYLKLVGSLVIMMCVAAGIIFAAINSKACEKTVEYTKEFEKDTQGIPTLEGYLFGGYYVDDESDVDGKKPLTSIEGLAVGTYYAKFVPADVLGIKAQISANIVADDRGDKTVENKENNAIRFVTSIDSTEYKHIGFVIQKGPEATADTVETTKYVYPELYYIDPEEGVQSANAGEIFCKDVSAFFKTFTITQVPQTVFNTDITVTPYWDTLDGTRVYGKTSIKTVNLGRSWFYVDNAENAVTNSAAPLGTYSNPYSVLQTALDADGGKYAPKIILKSDYELSEGVTVTQSLTLASEENKSISRADSWTDDRMLTVNADGKTVTLEDITINGKKLGACVELSKGTLHMLDGSIITNGKVTGSSYGANVAVEGGTLIMEDGSEISDGTTERHGGNVLLKGTLTMNGGTISGGKAISTSTSGNYGCGGNIHTYSTAKLTINGGEILNGLAQNSANTTNVARGGNICSAVTINMYGGKISGGVAEATYKPENTETTVDTTNKLRGCGGNISTGNLNIFGGEISDGTAKSNNLAQYTGCGGNIYSTGTVKITGEDALITGGTAEILSTTEIKTHTFAGCGGNIFSTNKVNISNGEISSGTAYTKCKTYSTGCGGNIYSQAEVIIEGADTIIKDGTAKATTVSQNNFGFGGNICMYGTDANSIANLSITDSTISGGKAAGRGGNIQALQHANITLTGATVSEGSIRNASGDEVSGNGGNIFISKASLTLNEGTKIEKGAVRGNGGNIAYNASDVSYKLTINSGVTITEGSATNGGNLSLQGTKGKVDLNGGSITNGTATTLGDNIYFHEATPVNLGSDIITVSNVEAKSGVAYTFNILEKLHADTRISVTLAAGIGVFAQYEDVANYQDTDLACFASDNNAYVVSYAEGKYSLVPSETTE